MPRIADSDIRRYAFECAWHLSVGMSVDEIAEATKRSRPTVYRALDNARDLGWLSDQPRLTIPRGAERDELERYVADRYKANEVLDTLGRSARPQEIIVVPSPSYSPEEAWRAAVCQALRVSNVYQNAWRSSTQPDWNDLLPGLIHDVSESERVQEAGLTETALGEIILRHVDQPYTRQERSRSRRVGRAAAERFCRALEEGLVKCVGISWGYHVHYLVDAVRVEFPAYAQSREDHKSTIEHIQRLRIFPLIGSLGLDPFVDAREHGTACGATANCAAIASRMGAPDPVPLTQPAYIPRAFSQADPLALRRIWEYVEQDMSIQLVFGEGLADRRVTPHGEPIPDPAEELLENRDRELPKHGYVGDADTLVTGIGTCSRDSRAPRLGILSADELKELRAAGATGDLSGQFFWDRTDPPSDEDKQRIRKVNSRIISPRLGDFVAVTREAIRRGKGELGTVVLASGAHKARAVQSLCYWQAVGTLIIDSDLADALIELA